MTPDQIAKARGFRDAAEMLASIAKRDSELASEIQLARDRKERERLRSIRATNQSEAARLR